MKGSVVVSLREMNKVLEIDDDLAYAVVEPGVRWFDLCDALRDGGHRLMASVPDVGWGSVIGTNLDNGITYMPLGVDKQAPCGMEVVLPDGEVVRTGMGGVPDSPTWNLYKHGFGPSLQDMFLQSGFGIVTKMGYWLMPFPEVYMPLWLRVWNEDDVAMVCEVARELALDGTIRMVPQIINTPLWASVVSRREQWYQGDGPMPEETLERIGLELEVGRWMMRFALYGDEPVVDHRFAKIKTAFEGRIEGAEVWGAKHSPEEVPDLPHPVERLQAGVPSLDVNDISKWHGGDEGGHLDYSPVVPLTGHAALKMRDQNREIVHSAGFDHGVSMPLVNARSMCHISALNFDTRNEEQVRKAFETVHRMVAAGDEGGYGIYRGHLDVMDQAAGQFSFNNHIYRRLCETIKDAVDPKGIMAPGKQGIWPKDRRQAATS